VVKTKQETQKLIWEWYEGKEVYAVDGWNVKQNEARARGEKNGEQGEPSSQAGKASEKRTKRQKGGKRTHEPRASQPFLSHSFHPLPTLTSRPFYSMRDGCPIMIYVVYSCPKPSVSLF